MLINDYKLTLSFKSYLNRYIFKDIKRLLWSLDGVLITVANKIITLPIRVKKFSVVRAPTTSKLSKEQFEVRIYRANVIFLTQSHVTLLLLMQYIINYIPSFSYLLCRVSENHHE